MFNKSLLRTYASYINIFSRFSDPLIVVAAAYLAYWIRFDQFNLALPKDYQLLLLFCLFSLVIIFPQFNLYASWRGQSLAKQARSVFFAWLGVVMLIIIILFGLKISAAYSRLWLGYWAVTGLFLLLNFRLCIYFVLQYQRSRGRNTRRIVLIGAGDLAKRVIDQVKNSPWTGYVIDGLFDDSSSLQGKEVGGFIVKGTLSEVELYLAANKIDEVWLALPLRAEKRMKEILYDIRHYTVNIKLIPDIFGFSLLYHSMTEIAGLPAVNLSDTPMDGGNKIIKAIEDQVLGLFIIILILPVAALIAIAIKLASPGPILFKQKRHGWDGRVINIYKFRTMEVQEEGGEVVQAMRSDPRITKIGSFLRRTSLDELPQFYNVLQGRMSIVGPRPHAIQHNEDYKNKVDKYMLRHMVKPGVTGWAQVNGLRGETDTLDKMKRRIEYDLYYIEHWSLWFDIKIIFLTIIKGFVNKNAY